MKIISPLFSSLRGSLGGAVGSVARGGITYLRAKVIPTNPSTLLQTAARSAVQSASALWQNTLTELEQDGWFEQAEGAQTGKSLFAKVNQPRIYANNTSRVTDETGASQPFDPPYFVDAPTGGLSVPQPVFSAAPVVDDSANTLTIGEAAAGLWNVGTDATHNAGLFVYVSGPQNPSRSVRQRPYQLIRAFSVNAATAFTADPINLAAFGIPTVTGKVFYVKVYAQDKAGRLSLPQEYRVTVVA